MGCTINWIIIGDFRITSSYQMIMLLKVMFQGRSPFQLVFMNDGTCCKYQGSSRHSKGFKILFLFLFRCCPWSMSMQPPIVSMHFILLFASFCFNLFIFCWISLLLFWICDYLSLWVNYMYGMVLSIFIILMLIVCYMLLLTCYLFVSCELCKIGLLVCVCLYANFWFYNSSFVLGITYWYYILSWVHLYACYLFLLFLFCICQKGRRLWDIFIIFMCIKCLMQWELKISRNNQVPSVVYRSINQKKLNWAKIEIITSK